LANLFEEIAKLFFRTAMKPIINKTVNDPELQKLSESIKYHTSEYDRKLKSLCERNPDHPKCKEYFAKFPKKPTIPYNVRDSTNFIYNNLDPSIKETITREDVTYFLNFKKQVYELCLQEEQLKAESLVENLDSKFTVEVKEKIYEFEKAYETSIGGTTMF